MALAATRHHSTYPEQGKTEAQSQSLHLPSPYPSPLSHGPLQPCDSKSLPRKHFSREHPESAFAPSPVSRSPADVNSSPLPSSLEPASPGDADGSTYHSTIVPSSEDPPIDTAPPTSINLTKVDYQSLPSRPDMAFFFYDPQFGEQVCQAYQRSRLTDDVRRYRYGAEAASTFKRGFTPSPVRRKWSEDLAEYIRRAELGLSDTEDEGDSQDISPLGTKKDVADPEEKTNNEVDKIDRDDLTTPLFSVRLRSDCDVLVEGEDLLSDGEKPLAGDGGRKRQRDGSGTPGDMDEQVKIKRLNNRRKPS